MSDRLAGLKSIKELDQLHEYPGIGGLSGIKSRNCDKLTLNESNEAAALIFSGTMFHNFGPLTANDIG